MTASPDNSLREHIAALPFVDTHSHMAGGEAGSPADDKGGKNLPQVLMSDHLRYLLEAQGEARDFFETYRQWRPEDAEAQMKVVLPLLDRLRHLTAYAVMRDGLRELYDLDDADVTEDNWRRINERVVLTYRRHGERAWQREAVRRCNVVLQNQMVTLPYVTDHWDALPPDERAAQKRFLLPSLILDGYLFSGFSADEAGRRRSELLVGLKPRTHAEFLSFLDKVLDLFVAKGGRSAKLMTAYHRTLRFEPVADLEARRLFARDPEQLRGEGLRRLQDNLCWHLLERCAKRNLPLIVHTGYASPTGWADPEHLLPMLTSPRLAGMNFDLSHSGWPNHGKAILLAGAFPHAYFNLCWTPVLSRALGRRLLSEAIDMLPADKILIGTDTATAEAFVGTVWLVRALLTEVLEEKVREGQFSLEVGKRLACSILLDNPLKFYRMSQEDVPSLESQPAISCMRADMPAAEGIQLPFLDPG